ncbi:hypothetical protein Tco_1015444 [Tanacetum coccineum]|uniref:Uncharacterized protein n=1 Tax=Tanacetum coccineum TaxID=301880 RepID=A0ABQ5FLX1_9ASTR
MKNQYPSNEITICLLSFASSSGATHASDFEAFQKYSHLCARNVTPRLHANFSEVVDANNEENVQSMCNEPINSACLHTEGASHANIVENAQNVCNEPINSVCLHTRDSNDADASVLTRRKRTCQNTQARRLANEGAFVIVLGVVHNSKIVHNVK